MFYDLLYQLCTKLHLLNLQVLLQNRVRTGQYHLTGNLQAGPYLFKMNMKQIEILLEGGGGVLGLLFSWPVTCYVLASCCEDDGWPTGWPRGCSLRSWREATKTVVS
jgi:hypothetical protein